MKHEVPWNTQILDAFIKCASLSEEQAEIMRMRVKNNTSVRTSEEVNISKATYDRRIEELKELYDVCCFYYPHYFPERDVISKKDKCKMRCVKDSLYRKLGIRPRLYDAKYSKFNGTININNAIIDFGNNTFNGLNEVSNYVIEQVEEQLQLGFENISEIEMNVNVRVKIDIKKIEPCN